MLRTAKLSRTKAFLNIQKKERNALRVKKPGYSRFFSPRHLDPAFTLPEAPTEVISAIESSSSSNSTAMPGENHLSGESCHRRTSRLLLGAETWSQSCHFIQQKCKDTVFPINFEGAGIFLSGFPFALCGKC